jgi:seryl-tRNA synthetase
VLDLKLVRNNRALVEEALRKRGDQINLDPLYQLDEERRRLLTEVEQMKAKRNAVTQEVAKKKQAKEDAEELILEMRNLGDEIKGIDERVKVIEEELDNLLLTIPNIPHPSVPEGLTDQDNVEVRSWGDIPKFEYEPKAHWDIGESLGILDFPAASKVTGSRFAIYKGKGASLERALINFMLDTHINQHGYEEVFPPFIVHRRSMIGTGQLPKFEEDAFKLEGSEYFLIPTAEVPVTNMHREEILDYKVLPLYYVAYSACFRAEAGSHGRDTRGLIRQHQFNKVEMVKFVDPEKSYEELETLVGNAETILKMLNLPYRVVAMCAGDLGFTAAKKYDIEVWMPSYNRYVEISSCSNFVDFQARRANIRFKPENGKTTYIHTLNGSGLAVGRTVAAILENFQQKDGSVRIPEPLVKYLGTDILK